MIERFLEKFLLIITGLGLAIAPLSSLADAPASVPAKITPQEAAEKAPHRPVTPGQMDGRIAFVTAAMLEEFHYSHQRFDDPVSSRFFDHYLEALDPQHMHFLQSDVEEFERYRTNLDRLTLTPKKVADTRPACEIFNRFLERLNQRVAYVDDLLLHEKFTFDSDDRITINRKESLYPKDLTEAKALWRDRLRLEYLQERLGRVGPKKKAKEQSAKSEHPADAKPGTDNSVKKADTKPKSESEEIVEKLTRRYRLNLKTFTDWNNDDVLQVYLTALARVYDPHSDYLGKAQFDNFSMQMNLALFGIGAELTSEDGYCTIRRLLPGGPASKSGKIKEKDRIVEVAQSNQPPVEVVEMALNKAVQLIRGPKGTEVRLTIIPADDPSERKVITLTRDEIKLEDSAAKAKIIDLTDAKGRPVRLGVIDLPSFYASINLEDNRADSGKHGEAPTPRSTTTDVAILLKKLEGEHVQGIILDLRGNGGGLLDEAVRLTGLFIKQGPVVQVRSDRNNLEIKEDQDPSVLYDGPLVVLTSRFSASASEIAAGALQDYGRALIVGDVSTHGKGSAQRLFSLRQAVGPSPLIAGDGRAGSGGAGGEGMGDPGALKITNAKFYRASGASTELKGVLPDIVLPSVLNYSKDVGESSLDNPLPYDTIQPARYEKLNRVEPFLGQLLKRSTDRISTNRDFAYIREDIELYRKLQADKTVSLNEKQRLKEKDESDARQKSRDKERLARKEPTEKVYELTLKLAQEPGLPAPVARTNAAMAKLSKPPGGLPGATTNSTSAMASTSIKAADAVDADAEETPAAVDAALDETEHILVDYLSLLTKKDVMTADQPIPATTRQ